MGYDAEREARGLFDVIGNDGQPSEESIKAHYSAALRAAYDAGADYGWERERTRAEKAEAENERLRAELDDANALVNQLSDSVARLKATADTMRVVRTRGAANNDERHSISEGRLERIESALRSLAERSVTMPTAQSIKDILDGDDT